MIKDEVNDEKNKNYKYYAACDHALRSSLLLQQLKAV